MRKFREGSEGKDNGCEMWGQERGTCEDVGSVYPSSRKTRTSASVWSRESGVWTEKGTLVEEVIVHSRTVPTGWWKQCSWWNIGGCQWERSKSHKQLQQQQRWTRLPLLRFSGAVKEDKCISHAKIGHTALSEKQCCSEDTEQWHFITFCGLLSLLWVKCYMRHLQHISE